MKTAIAIRHIAFEDLGTLEPELRARGFDVALLDARTDDLTAIDPAADLLIVLGGPMGADEGDRHAFLRDEIGLIRSRLQRGLPTLGICLGAQLIAVAAGGGVRRMGYKEIGMGPVQLNAAGKASCLAPLADSIEVLHWHGDEILLPAGATLLASTPLCATQAFAIGPATLGLQFHLEAELHRIREWTVGHAQELAEARIDIVALEQDAARCADGLRLASRQVLGAWLDSLGFTTAPAAEPAYQPIACEIHDYVEIACLHRYRLRIELTDGSSLEGQALTTESAPTKEEFVVVRSESGERRLRLDRLHAITPLNAVSSFGRVVLSRSSLQ